MASPPLLGTNLIRALIFQIERDLLYQARLRELLTIANETVVGHQKDLRNASRANAPRPAHQAPPFFGRGPGSIGSA